MTEKTYQVIKSEVKGGDFKGSVSLLSQPTSARLAITASDTIEEFTWNDLVIKSPNSRAWSGDVTRYTHVGDNFLSVKVNYSSFDWLLGGIKTCDASLTGDFPDLPDVAALSPSALSFANLQAAGDYIRGKLDDLGMWGKIGLVVVLIVVVILAIGYSAAQVKGAATPIPAIPEIKVG